jgi:tyrosine-protein phosphatase SIW14
MKRASFFSTLAISFTLLLGAATCNQKGGGAGGREGQTEGLATPRNDIPGLPNFARVSDHLYRGAQPTAEGFAALKDMGIKTVVNLRVVHTDKKLLEGHGLQYVHISFKPWHPEEEDFVKFLSVVTNPEYQPVFVHCQHGADRTGIMVALYRVAELGWKPERALEELPNFGFHEIWDDLREHFLELDVVKLKDRAKAGAGPVPELVP